MNTRVKTKYGKVSTTRKYWYIINELFSRSLTGKETIDISNILIKGDNVYADIIISDKDSALSLQSFSLPCSLSENCEASIVMKRGDFNTGMYTNLFGKVLQRLFEALRSENEPEKKSIQRFIDEIKFQHESLLKSTEDTKEVNQSYYFPDKYAENLTRVIGNATRYLDELDANWGRMT